MDQGSEWVGRSTRLMVAEYEMRLNGTITPFQRWRRAVTLRRAATVEYTVLVSSESIVARYICAEKANDKGLILLQRFSSRKTDWNQSGADKSSRRRHRWNIPWVPPDRLAPRNVVSIRNLVRVDEKTDILGVSENVAPPYKPRPLPIPLMHRNMRRDLRDVS